MDYDQYQHEGEDQNDELLPALWTRDAGQNSALLSALARMGQL